MGTSLSSLPFSSPSLSSRKAFSSLNRCASRARIDRRGRISIRLVALCARIRLDNFSSLITRWGQNFPRKWVAVWLAFSREKCEMYRSKGVRTRFFRAFTSSRGCARVRVCALRAVIASSSLSAVFVFFLLPGGNLSLSFFLWKILTFVHFSLLLSSSNKQVKREV